MLFSYQFFIFSQHLTNFITENFKITVKSQSTEQIIAKYQHHTPPKLQFNPRQQTPAIKSHNHQNTTTTPPQQQKTKSQREIGGSKALDRRRDRAEARSKASSSGEIKRHDAIGAELRSTRLVRSCACDCQTRAQGSPATSKAWSRLPLLPLVRALSLCASGLEMIWSENFRFKPFLGSKPHFIRFT